MVSSIKSVLITGAGGFIGLNVVKAFQLANWHVIAMVHNNIPQELYEMGNVEILRADMTDEAVILTSLKGKRPDVVVHVAGLASDIGSDEVFRKINFEPLKFYSRLGKKKFIYISSTDVYGIKDFNGENETLQFEEKPVNPYPKYKIEAEKWMRENLDPEKFVIIRPAAVWGEGDKTLEARVVDFLETSPYIIHFGKWRGKNRWPLANVKNVAYTILSVCESDEFNGEAINIIDKEFTTIDEYYKFVAKKYFPDKKFKTIILPMWIGFVLGWISTFLSNIFRLKKPLFDPTLYSVRHVSNNLDLDGSKMLKALSLLTK